MSLVGSAFRAKSTAAMTLLLSSFERRRDKPTLHSTAAGPRMEFGEPVKGCWFCTSPWRPGRETTAPLVTEAAELGQVAAAARVGLKDGTAVGRAAKLPASAGVGTDRGHDTLGSPCQRMLPLQLVQKQVHEQIESRPLHSVGRLAGLLSVGRLAGPDLPHGVSSTGRAGLTERGECTGDG